MISSSKRVYIGLYRINGLVYFADCSIRIVDIMIKFVVISHSRSNFV